jgi:hypothetical protein
MSACLANFTAAGFNGLPERADLPTRNTSVFRWQQAVFFAARNVVCCKKWLARKGEDRTPKSYDC